MVPTGWAGLTDADQPGSAEGDDRGEKEGAGVRVIPAMSDPRFFLCQHLRTTSCAAGEVGHPRDCDEKGQRARPSGAWTGHPRKSARCASPVQPPFFAFGGVSGWQWKGDRWDLSSWVPTPHATERRKSGGRLTRNASPSMLSWSFMFWRLLAGVCP